MPNMPSVQPPKNSVTIRQEFTIIIEYSPSMKNANFIAEYSV